MGTALAKVIPIFKRASQRATFVKAPKKSLTLSQQRQAASSLRPSLQSGWANFFYPIRAGRYYTVPNLCPHCGHHPPKDMKSPLQRRRYMFVHAVVAHH